LTPKEKQERDSKYKKAQTLIIKTLHRLRQLGLVQLIRQRRYVKQIRLTAKVIAQWLKNKGDGNGKG